MSLQGRLGWSIDMQQDHALGLYRAYWDVDDIIEVDEVGQSVPAMQLLDFSGLDKVIKVGTKHIHIAQRFRMMRNEGRELTRPDFSLREETYSDGPTEYDKLVDNYTSRFGSVPSVYAFGITTYGRRVALEEGFIEFYLIDLNKFLEEHLYGPIEPVEGGPNGDGSKGMYFDIDDLADNGCIIDEISEVNND